MFINLTQTAMSKLLALSKASGSDEIGGIMIGYPNGTQIIVTDITIPKQEVTAASISFDDNSINDQLSALFFSESKMGFVGWWHTHGTGKTFWSTTDQKDGIDKFLKPLIDNVDGSLDCKWLASVVANANGDLLGRVDYYTQTPFGNFVQTINEVPVVCLPVVNEKQIAWAKEQIAANVTKHVYAYQSYKRGKGKGSRVKNLYYDEYCALGYENFDDEADIEDEVTIMVATEEPASETDEVKATGTKYSQEDEELIDIAMKSFNVDREAIEDLVNLCGYSVSDAIDILTEVD